MGTYANSVKRVFTKLVYPFITVIQASFLALLYLHGQQPSFLHHMAFIGHVQEDPSACITAMKVIYSVKASVCVPKGCPYDAFAALAAFFLHHNRPQESHRSMRNSCESFGMSTVSSCMCSRLVQALMTVMHACFCLLVLQKQCFQPPSSHCMLSIRNVQVDLTCFNLTAEHLSKNDKLSREVASVLLQ